MASVAQPIAAIASRIERSEIGEAKKGVVEALFADCLLLGEETMNALRGVSGALNLKLIPPDAIDDFPHCQCQVVATVSMLTQFIQDDLL